LDIKRTDENAVFLLADSLEPGTYVPIVPFEENGYFLQDDPFSESDDKMRAIKERLKQKVGDYGMSDGLTLQERVKLKIANHN